MQYERASGSIPEEEKIGSFNTRFNNLLTDQLQASQAAASDELRPFDSASFLQARLASPNRALRTFPELKEDIENALTDTADKSIIDTAHLLVDALDAVKPQNQRPINAILSYMTLTESIYKYFTQLHDAQASMGRANALSMVTGHGFVRTIPDNEVLMHYTAGEFMKGALDVIKGRGTAIATDYTYNKLSMVNSWLLSRYRFLTYAKAMPGLDEQTPSADTIARDSLEASAHFATMRANQQSGLKLGYKPHYLGGSMIISRPYAHEVLERHADDPNMHPLTAHSPAVAEIVHSTMRSFKRPKPTETSRGRQIILSYDQLGMMTLTYLGEDGELYMDAQCGMPVRDVFVGQGKYGSYRTLQAEILSSYFDMTQQPTDTVIRAQRAVADSMPTPIGPTTPKDPMDSIGRLVVPRIRTITDTVQTDHEAAQEEQDSAASVRYHGVAWHRRRLPEGWKPSPQALELAAEMGIQLNEGETLVRDYTRGNKALGQIVGHRLIERED